MSEAPWDAWLDRSERRDDPTAWSASSEDGVVATAHYLATEAGAGMLTRGGNAIDAAVAAGLALAVCEPAGSGLGGSAIMVVHLAQRKHTFVLAGPCRAPRAASPGPVAEANRYRGYASVAVPTHTRVLGTALARYGTQSPATVLEPAIRLAAEGFPQSPMQTRLVGDYHAVLARSNVAHLFIGADGAPLPPGTWIRQPALAATLCRLRTAGFEDFHQGEIARGIDADMRRAAGFLRLEDLRDLGEPEETAPLVSRLGDVLCHTAGPPAGGLALVEMLNVLDALDRHAPLDLDTPAGAVLLASTIRKAREDRRKSRLRVGAESLGRAAELASAPYASQVAAGLRTTGAGETSHVSVADRAGNLVSLTQSIERSFGAAVATPSLGFLYNGFLRGFKVRNTRHPHYLSPGAPARSNAAPSVLLRDGGPWGAIGSTGSERLASGIAQVLLRLERQDPFAAVLAPRLHCTPRGRVLLEGERMARPVLEALLEAGFRLKPVDAYSFRSGGLNLVVRRGQAWCGVGEPRRDGAAAGPGGPPVRW